MEIRTVYVAEDGAEFNTEAECLAYEKRGDFTDDPDIKLWDEDKKPLLNVRDIGFDSVFYIHAATDEAAEKIFQEAEYQSESSPWDGRRVRPKAGSYFYDRKSGEWLSADKIFELTKKLLEVFKEVKPE